jgi:hypothetical protein
VDSRRLKARASSGSSRSGGSRASRRAVSASASGSAAATRFGRARSPGAEPSLRRKCKPFGLDSPAESCRAPFDAAARGCIGAKLASSIARVRKYDSEVFGLIFFGGPSRIDTAKARAVGASPAL